MKYCGCRTCKANGEENPHEFFELYYSTRVIEQEGVFNSIMNNSFSVGELEELNKLIEGETPPVVTRINLYGLGYYGPPENWMIF